MDKNTYGSITIWHLQHYLGDDGRVDDKRVANDFAAWRRLRRGIGREVCFTARNTVSRHSLRNRRGRADAPRINMTDHFLPPPRGAPMKRFDAASIIDSKRARFTTSPHPSLR